MENPTNRDPIGPSTINDAASPFGPIIYSHSRAQAIADGVMVDVSSKAREAGFSVPVAITSAAWADCVEWSDQDSSRQNHQDESGQLWDVPWMSHLAARRAQGGTVNAHHTVLPTLKNNKLVLIFDLGTPRCDAGKKRPPLPMISTNTYDASRFARDRIITWNRVAWTTRCVGCKNGRAATFASSGAGDVPFPSMGSP